MSKATVDVDYLGELAGVYDIPESPEGQTPAAVRERMRLLEGACRMGPGVVKNLEREATTPDGAARLREAQDRLVVAKNLRQRYAPVHRRHEQERELETAIEAARSAVESFEALEDGPVREIVAAHNALAQGEAKIRTMASTLERAYRSADLRPEVPRLSARAIAAIRTVQQVAPQTFRGIDVDFLVRVSEG